MSSLSDVVLTKLFSNDEMLDFDKLHLPSAIEPLGLKAGEECKMVAAMKVKTTNPDGVHEVLVVPVNNKTFNLDGLQDCKEDWDCEHF